ncbi:hypothetical protein ACMSEH_06360 [Bacteroides thetaiotaomicron]|uniref:hypothetical protein n=1 Tax=Bacteroides thetaiotaomicron TaxID=818 RepID=UPI0039C4D75C
MIKLFEILETLDKKMSSFKSAGEISDYRILLTVNNTVKLYVLSGTKSKQEVETELKEFPDLSLEFIETGDESLDDFLIDLLFSENQTINTSNTQRRLGNLLNPIQKVYSSLPVVTFYSYKGGVGRSTSLASCASYLSIHYKKKIVILDCDFEAPGFTNFFFGGFLFSSLQKWFN